MKITNTLNGLKLKNRFVILLLLPILGLLYDSGTLVFDKYYKHKEMDNITSLVNLSVTSSKLVHESQKERGRTAGFLGSSGKKFSSELTNQRQETDKRIAELNEYLKSFDEDKFSDEFKSTLSANMELLGKIEEMRSGISNQNIKVNEAIGYYTKINSGFLKLDEFIPHLSSDAELNTLASAYTNFLIVKEHSGIERAVLSNTFALNKFGDGMFVKFIKLMNTQDNYLKVFNSFAKADLLSYYNSQISHKSFEEVKNLRKIALDQSETGGFGVDAGNWFSTITEKINVYKEIEDHIADELISLAEDHKSSALTELVNIIILSSVILLIVAFLSVIIVRGILAQIGGEPNEVVEIAERISNGDLTISNDNEKHTGIYGSMFVMAEKLKDIVSNIINSTDQISAASGEISGASQSLSQGASEQAANIEEVSSSMEQMAANIDQNTDNSQQTNEIAETAADQVLESNKSTESAVESINKIAEKISVISDIAFQTNILSLNAAVEAARAGEHGKGFAVVAREVQKLAETSKVAAEDINSLSADGVSVVEKASEKLKEVVPQITKTATLTKEISTSSLEQRSASNEINTAIQQLNAITQQNASSSEQLASNSEELAAQGEQLREMIAYFKV